MKAEHDFKPGEVIELIDGELPQMPLGSRVVVEEQSRAAPPRSVTYRDKDGSLTWRPADYFRRIESPIRTVTRRIIEDGQSGGISWKGHKSGSIWIAISPINAATAQFVQVNKSDLTNVGLIISQLAEFLDEDKGGE